MLQGIPPAPRGVPQIEVSFDIDANGIVNVSARDKATGKEHSITVAGSSGLSKDEIERMVRDAEKFADADAKAKELIEARNSVESTVDDIEKNMRQFEGQLDMTEEEKMRQLIKDVRKAAEEATEAEAIKSKLGELQNASLQLFQRAYQKKMEEQNQQGGDKKEPNVSEAEIKNDDSNKP